MKQKNRANAIRRYNWKLQCKSSARKRTLSAISYQTVNKCSVVRLFEWEFTESAGAKSSCRITRGSSIFIVPWKRERKRRKKKRTRHPWLVTVTNRGYYTSSKFFFPPEISQRTESGNCNWCEARAKIYSRTDEMSERKPLLIWSNNSKHNQKTQSLDAGWQSEHKRFHCPAALLTNVAKNINQLWITCVKRWFSL